MNLRRIYAILLRQYYLQVDSKTRFISLFYWSTVELFVWGVITRYLVNLGGANFKVLGILVGTVIFWNFFTRIQQGMTSAFLEDIWTRNLINIFSSPITLGEYLAGLIFTSIITTLLAVLSMIVLAWVLFAYDIFQFGLYIVPFVAILFIFGWAMGIFATAAVLRMGPAAEIVVWSLPTFIMPFSGVFYPISTLPLLVQPFSYLLPTTYVFEGMREVIQGGVFLSNYFFMALFLSLLYFIFSITLLYYVYGFIRKAGLFTRHMTS